MGALHHRSVEEEVPTRLLVVRIVLRDAGARMGVNDSWIAATALALAVRVVTQDDDYVTVAGLEVIHADTVNGSGGPAARP